MTLISTIQWIRPEVAVPDDEASVILVLRDGEIIPGFRDAGQWRNYGAAKLPNPPLFWASFPEAPKP